MGSSQSGARSGRGRWSHKVPSIAAEVVRRSQDGRPPDREEIRKAFPEAHVNQIQEGYRIGCLDLVMSAQNEDLPGSEVLEDTPEGHARIADRIQKLRSLKQAQGEPNREPNPDSIRFPAVYCVRLPGSGRAEADRSDPTWG